MNPASSPTHSEDRLLALEKRLAELEQHCEAANLTIPWHVICAAVAAVMPNVRIVQVTQVSPTRNLWQTSALLQNVNSHQLR